MAVSASAALWFLPFVLPICLWVAWSDMKFMKIPNKAVLALLAVFVVIGLIALPFDVYKWRFVHIVVILVIGFVANMAGLLGAGDAKFAAAMAPFIALGDWVIFMYFFAAVLLAAFATHRLFRAIAPMRRATGDWASWSSSKFPMGLALGPTLIFYLIAGILLG